MSKDRIAFQESVLTCDIRNCPSPDSSESIFEAIQDQLGLRLEQTKGPVDFLVIDRVEHLVEN
jgi:uncharacterized protein (TIGR03435 family)